MEEGEGIAVEETVRSSVDICERVSREGRGEGGGTDPGSEGAAFAGEDGRFLHVGHVQCQRPTQDRISERAQGKRGKSAPRSHVDPALAPLLHHAQRWKRTMLRLLSPSSCSPRTGRDNRSTLLRTR